MTDEQDSNPPRKTRKTPAKSRRQARVMAFLGVYQQRLTGYDAAQVEQQLLVDPDFGNADAGFFHALLSGVQTEAALLEEALAPCLDRPLQELSPVERSVLMLAALELLFQPETPAPIILNEAVELAKTYGGTDGHKFVNAVLDALAARARPDEPRRIRRPHPARG